GGPLNFEYAVGQRGVGQWHTHSVTVQFAAQLGEDLGNGGGRAGGGRDQAHAAGAGTAQILVRGVEDALGVGQVMNGGDRTVADAEVLVDHLNHWSKAIGGTGGCGDDAVLRRIEQLLVDAHHYVECAFLLHGRADYDPLHAVIEVGLQDRHGLHLATGLDHQLAVRPVGVGNRLVGSDLDALAADHHAIAITAGF